MRVISVLQRIKPKYVGLMDEKFVEITGPRHLIVMLLSAVGLFFFAFGFVFCQIMSLGG